MQRFTLYMIFIIMVLKFGSIVAEQKEVLIRDRLVMVLCDQMDEYLSSGTLPQAIKSMPEKYKNYVPGSGAETVGNGAIAGRKVSKGRTANDLKSGEKPMRNKRAIATQKGTFEAPPNGHCLLDLEEQQ